MNICRTSGGSFRWCPLRISAALGSSAARWTSSLQDARELLFESSLWQQKIGFVDNTKHRVSTAGWSFVGLLTEAMAAMSCPWWPPSKTGATPATCEAQISGMLQHRAGAEVGRPGSIGRCLQ